MRKILIATHGNLADGFKSSVALLTGREACIQCINAYLDQSDYEQDLERFLRCVGPEDEAVIFTDLFGGSVNQKVMALRPQDRGIFVVSDFNLSAVLGVVLEEEPLTAQGLDQLLALCAKQLGRLPRPQSRLAASPTEREQDACFFA